MKRKFRGQLRVQRVHRTDQEHVIVTLELAEADAYAFEWRAEWPEASFDAEIERGTREGLDRAGYDPDAGVRVVVESISWEEGLSSPAAFEAAARDAVAGGPVDLEQVIESHEELLDRDLKIDTYCSRSGPSFMRITYLPTGVSVSRQVERSSHATSRELMAELRAKVLAGERPSERP